MSITTCDSPETLKYEVDLVRKKVALDETEETWDTIAQGILHLTRLCNIGGCQFPSEMVTGIRSIARPLSSALNSERSRLSGAAVELVTALATGLGSAFEPLVSHFVPTLLSLCGRTNKVFTSRARACILVIIQHTHLPSLLPYLSELANHKSVFPRLTAAEGILACLNCFNPPDLEKETRARAVEDFIKLTARDASADVRKASKEVFKAYKTLMPARVESFVAPLTPVIKKYLDIQVGAHASTSKLPSRPSSRANNKVAEAGQRPASSTLPKPPTRLAAGDSTHSTKPRPAVPAVVDAHVPRQRIVSQMRPNPLPRTLHVTTQSSSAAQRCIVPAPAPARQATQYPAPSVARVLPASNASSSKGPQRLPVQMKLNPPSDRLKVTGNGAKRIPIPSLSGEPSGQPTATANLGDQTGTNVDLSRSKHPSRNGEASESGKSTVPRKAPDGLRPPSRSNKPVSRSVPMAPTIVQRSNKPSVKDKVNPSGTAPHRRLAGGVQKESRPLVKAELKETPPALIPLPPSRPPTPAEVSLHLSSDPPAHHAEPQDEPAESPLSGPSAPAEKQLKVAEPFQEQANMDPPSTPITTLLASIQRGFLFTPSSPLSPPQNYLAAAENPPRQDMLKTGDFAKTLMAGAVLCTSLDGVAGDTLDRHALKNLN